LAKMHWFCQQINAAGCKSKVRSDFKKARQT
jgi:hypothetical protein